VIAAPAGGQPRLTLPWLREIALSADHFCDLEHLRVNSHAQTPYYQQKNKRYIHSILFFKKLNLIHLMKLIFFKK
jgi:hypothetical protein